MFVIPLDETVVSGCYLEHTCGTLLQICTSVCSVLIWEVWDQVAFIISQ